MRRLAPHALLLALLLPACGGDATPPPASDASTHEAAADAADAVAPEAADSPASDPAAEAAVADSPPARDLDEPSELVESIKPIDDGPPLASLKKRVDLPMDSSNSTIDWIAFKNGPIEVKGRFSALAGSLSIDPNDLRTARGEVGIDLAGISTGEEARDSNISTLFFGTSAKEPVHGQVTMTGLRPEAIKLAVGESTRALGQMGFTLGGDAIGAVLPLKIERLGEAQWKLSTLETFEVSIAGMGMSGQKAALLKACEHEAIGDGVQATGSVIFGESN